MTKWGFSEFFPKNCLVISFSLDPDLWSAVLRNGESIGILILLWIECDEMIYSLNIDVDYIFVMDETVKRK